MIASVEFAKLEAVRTPSGDPWTKLMPNKVRDREQVDPALGVTITACTLGLQSWPLYIWGEAGSGKTCAALLVCDWAGRAVYYTQADLCNELIAAGNGSHTWTGAYKMTVPEIWRAWERANVTVLDELAERTTVSDYQCEVVKRAIDLRENKPSIVISNRSIAEIANIFGDPIASRLGGGTSVKCKGDRRIKA